MEVQAVDVDIARFGGQQLGSWLVGGVDEGQPVWLLELRQERRRLEGSFGEFLIAQSGSYLGREHNLSGAKSIFLEIPEKLRLYGLASPVLRPNDDVRAVSLR